MIHSPSFPLSNEAVCLLSITEQTYARILILERCLRKLLRHLARLIGWASTNQRKGLLGCIH